MGDSFVVEQGAWGFTKRFLIHDGPDNNFDKDSPYAAIGCIEICGGPFGFEGFDKFIVDPQAKILEI